MPRHALDRRLADDAPLPAAAARRRTGQKRDRTADDALPHRFDRRRSRDALARRAVRWCLSRHGESYDEAATAAAKAAENLLLRFDAERDKTAPAAAERADLPEHTQ